MRSASRSLCAAPLRRPQFLYWTPLFGPTSSANYPQSSFLNTVRVKRRWGRVNARPHVGQC